MSLRKGGERQEPLRVYLERADGHARERAQRVLVRAKRGDRAHWASERATQEVPVRRIFISIRALPARERADGHSPARVLDESRSDEVPLLAALERASAQNPACTLLDLAPHLPYKLLRVLLRRAARQIGRKGRVGPVRGADLHKEGVDEGGSGLDMDEDARDGPRESTASVHGAANDEAGEAREERGGGAEAVDKHGRAAAAGLGTKADTRRGRSVPRNKERIGRKNLLRHQSLKRRVRIEEERAPVERGGQLGAEQGLQRIRQGSELWKKARSTFADPSGGRVLNLRE